MKLALALLLAASPAYAVNCGPRAAVLDKLAGKYGETRQSIGLGANSAVVEVFASTDSGSWTITVTTPQGVTCLVASGLAFERMDEPDEPT